MSFSPFNRSCFLGHKSRARCLSSNSLFLAWQPWIGSNWGQKKVKSAIYQPILCGVHVAIIIIWLVVSTLWKIWYSQLGWLYIPNWMEQSKMFQSPPISNSWSNPDWLNKSTWFPIISSCKKICRIFLSGPAICPIQAADVDTLNARTYVYIYIYNIIAIYIYIAIYVYSDMYLIPDQWWATLNLSSKINKTIPDTEGH